MMYNILEYLRADKIMRPGVFESAEASEFTLLSDESNDVSTRYGAWTLKSNYGRTYMGIVRSSFLIDPDGRIAHVWPKVKADGHAADVIAVLAAAKTLRHG